MSRPLPSASVMALALAAGASVALGQAEGPGDGEPVVVGADQPRWKWTELASLTAAFEVYGRNTTDKISQDGEPDRTDTELLIRETLNLDTELYIGHKNFIDFTALTKLGFEERWINSQTADSEEQNNDFTFLYDINALVFGASKLPVTVYTRRDQQYLDRDFSTSIIDTVMETGIRATYVSETAPTTIHIFRNTNDQEEASGASDYKYAQNTASLQNALIFTKSHRLETNYTFDNVTERLQNSTNNDYNRHDLLLTDIITFGDLGQHEARTYFRFYDQSGDFGFTSARLEEQVRMLHSRDLQSRYNFRAETLNRDGVDQNIVNGQATVIHNLFDSLTTTATAGGDYLSTSEDFDSHGAYIHGSFDYTKLAGPGRIDATLGGGIASQWNGERGGTLNVVDDPRVFVDPQPITISRRNIEQGSVMLTGPGGVPTYVEGIDYTVEYYPDRVEITPILGGAITDGSVVLVDYTIGPEPSSHIDTYDTVSSFRYTFREGWVRGLSLYTSYRTLDHSLDTDDPSVFALDTLRNWQYGAEYRRSWFGAKAEREMQDSTQNPYDATRFQVLGEYPLGPASRIGVQADYEIYDYYKPDNHVNFFRVTSRWNQQWTRGLDTLLRFDYRNEENDRQGNSDGIDAVLSVRWRTRQTSMYVTVRKTLVGAESSDTDSQFIEFGFRREF